jgi:predicted MFS family arabinose efflux permease
MASSRSLQYLYLPVCNSGISLLPICLEWRFWMALIVTACILCVLGRTVYSCTGDGNCNSKAGNTHGSFMSISSSLQQLSAGLAAYVAGVVVVKQPDGSFTHYDWVGYMSIAATLICLYLARRIRTADGKLNPLSFERRRDTLGNISFPQISQKSAELISVTLRNLREIIF